MFEPIFSVVIPTYNSAKFIAKTLDCLKSQIFKSFEVVIINDGSYDDTQSVISRYAAANPDLNIRLFNQENKGIAGARNRGLLESKGCYISFLDHDDVWYPEKLNWCFEALKRHSEVDLVCHNEAVIYHNKILRRTSYGPYVENMYFRLLFEGNCLHASAVTIRRSVFFEDGFKFSEDKDLSTIEDYELWLRLSKRYRFYFLPEVLGCYQLADSGAFLKSAESNTQGTLRLLNSHFDKIKNKTIRIKLMVRKRRSSVMCAAGRMLQHKREFTKSQKWYLKAIAQYPLNYKAYVCFVTTLLKLRIVYK